MRKVQVMLLVLVALVLLLAPVAAVAQATAPEVKVAIDPSIADAILAVWGIGVLAITQLIKNVLKVDDWPKNWKDIAGYAISFIVAFAGTLFVLLSKGAFTWAAAAVYTVWCWGVANGLFKYGRDMAARVINNR